MWRSKDRPEGSRRIEATYCPVCNVYFGRRDWEIYFMARCKECKATFHWKPGEDKPSVVMDSKPTDKCGCERCGR